MAEEATTEVKVAGKAAKNKTLKADYALYGDEGVYQPGHVFEGDIPAFVQAQIQFGVAELV
jgi:hypothetical protein